MVRLEDLVFFPRQVLQAVCECVGGQLRDDLSLVGDTSKKGGENIHGSNKTDLRNAMISHIYMNRTMGMTSEDLNYAIVALRDSPVMKKMGYHGDPRWKPLIDCEVHALFPVTIPVWSRMPPPSFSMRSMADEFVVLSFRRSLCFRYCFDDI